MVADIECQPCLSGQRWEREKRLLGFTEGEITAELARRWNFPMQMVQALQRSADPVIEQAFSRLGAVIHLAAWLADMPVGAAEDPTGDALSNLPLEVVDSLRFDLLSLQASFPDASSFVELSAL